LDAEDGVKGGIRTRGHCDRRFQGVREVFARNFEQGQEVGASFAAVLDGEFVVDIWAGHADAARTRAWERDTIVNVFSTTKVMASTCTLMLVDRGALDLDSPAARYWPEFAEAGKERVLVRHLLSHTAGLPGWQEPIAVKELYDWERAVGLLAAQEPWWEPGTRSGYHSLTHGFLLGEVVRRVSGRSLGSFFREEVAEPLGADFHIGLPEEHEPRVGEMIPPSQAELGAALESSPGSIAARMAGNPPLDAGEANTRDWRAAEIPAANGHGNARSVARVAAALACGGTLDGVTLMGPATLEKAIEEQCYSEDLVLGLPVRWGLGFGLTSKDLPVGPNPRACYWGGWGGSVVVMDLDARFAFSYVMNKMSAATMGDPRGLALAVAAFQGLQ
jgi:CubicO group peptidase (beta-lactamase class C family)